MTIDPRDFGRLEGKVDEILRRHTEHDSAMAALDVRTRKNEEAIAQGDGRRSILSVVTAAVVSLVVGIVGHKIS